MPKLPASISPQALPRAPVRPTRWALAACAALALAALPACATKPSLSVHHAEVRSGSFEGLGVLVYVDVDNSANDIDIEIRNLRATVTMAGSYRLAPVDVALNKWVRSDKTTRIAVPVTIPWTVVPRIIASTAGSSAISYRIKGTADVTGSRAVGVRRNNIPVDEQGTISRRLVVDAARSGSPL